MSELKHIVADNIIKLRRAHNVTQAALAEKLNYTDKAVSKWERGESLPDVTVLKEIADYFGVTVDYLLSETHSVREDKSKFINHMVIEAISCALIYACATIAYFVLKLALPDTAWLSRVFICALPACFILLLTLNSVWGKIKYNYLIISLLIWTSLLTVFVFWFEPFIFILGIPMQIIVLLSMGFRFPTKDDHSFFKKRD